MNAEAIMLLLVLQRLMWYKIGPVAPSRKTLLIWYNRLAKRSVTIRCVDYYLKWLVDASYLERTRRTLDKGAKGKYFKTSIYHVTPEGTEALSRLGF